MNQITRLREKRAKVWEEAKAFLDEHRGEDDLLSAGDAAIYERMEADVVNLGKEVERLERRAVLDLELSQATSQALRNVPARPEEKTESEYTRAFWNMMRRPAVTNEDRQALTVGTNEEGGYLVPDEFEHTLIEALEEENIMRTLANRITTSSGDRKIPVVASKGSATWVDEEGPIIESGDTFTQVSIGAHKLATMIKVSEELLLDSVFDLASYIAKEFGRRIGAREEEAFFIGDGDGKPVGIFNTTGGAEIGVTAGSKTAITADELLDLFYSLKAPYRNKASFVMNDGTIKAIRKLKDGSGQYLWQPSIAAGEPDTLLNRPLKTSAYVPSVTDGAKVIAFGDFSYYWIADRQGRAFQRLNELFAATGQIGFKATQRVDGRLILKEAVKILRMKA